MLTEPSVMERTTSWSNPTWAALAIAFKTLKKFCSKTAKVTGKERVTTKLKLLRQDPELRVNPDLQEVQVSGFPSQVLQLDEQATQF